MNPELTINIVGVAAGLCSMVSFVPQIGKILKTKAAEGVSLKMFSVTVTAFVLWTTYGLLLGSWPIALSNAVCLCLALAIVALRLKFGDGAS
ncbi:MAG TPA: SemiSWEET family transporter [Hyphomonadaceae bacterium]|jgi:MtN3 and saliva related transmembrane protein|nr:SemiSWEET family transporter [Hyphomonadaceae bacterium]